MLNSLQWKPIQLHFGTPSPDEAKDAVIGREEDARQFWENVSSGSLRLLSERRMGKTWLLKLALAKIPSGIRAVFIDAQADQSMPELVCEINRNLHLRGLVPDDWKNKVEDWLQRQLLKLHDAKIGTCGISGFDDWRTLLEDTCRHFVKQSGENLAVLIIDELPFFLDKLIKDGRHADAARLLDILRELRHALPTLRMVYCGSLGLHIVLNKLKETNYSGRPINDMPPMELSPLNEENAHYLAGCLILGESLNCGDLEKCAAAVSKTASSVPFYIQHVIKSSGPESPSMSSRGNRRGSLSRNFSTWSGIIPRLSPSIRNPFSAYCAP